MTALPSDWEIATVGKVLRLKYGKALNVNLRDPDARYPVVGSAGKMTATAIPLAEEPVVVIGRKGNVGAAQLESSGCWPIDTTYYAAIPEGFDARFVLHQLVALDLKRFDSSTTTPSLRRQDLEAQSFVVPPLDEQLRIVELLEDHLSRLDAADRETGSAVRKLDALARAYWKRIFVNTDVEPVPLLDFATIANGQTPKGLADRLVEQPSATTVPFFKVGDMNAGDGRYMSTTRNHVEEKDAKSLGIHIRDAGTVLIPKRGGAIATNKKRLLTDRAAYDLNTMGLVSSEGLSPLYLWHWLQGLDLGKLADGSQVPQINAPQIRGLALPVPSREVQVRIVEGLESELEARTRLATAAADSQRR